eukprot:COSAG03_NODE_941_length_5251_cov_254.015334_2_plen_93_part_00
MRRARASTTEKKTATHCARCQNCNCAIVIDARDCELTGVCRPSLACRLSLERFNASGLLKKCRNLHQDQPHNRFAELSFSVASCSRSELVIR